MILSMQIWIDNDGCPRMARELVFKAATRLKVPVHVVANSYMHLPPSPLFKMVTVAGTFDAADQHIADHVEPLDLVVTADVPLAQKIVKKGAYGLNPRGEVYDESNVDERLSVRNLMAELRSGGEAMGNVGGGPPPLGEADKKRFANALDRLLTQLVRGQKP
jgi:uncharacterized protein YaiI (UPF0178 family)